MHGDSPRLGWRLGRIVDLHKSQDGVCRAASVRLSGNRLIVKRSVTSLYPLEESDGGTESHIQEEGDHRDVKSSESGKFSSTDCNVSHRVTKNAPETVDEICDNCIKEDAADKRGERPRRAAAVAGDLKRRLTKQN